MLVNLFYLFQMISIVWAVLNITADVILVNRKNWCLMSKNEPDCDGYFTPHKYGLITLGILLSFYIPKFLQ